MKHHQLPQKFLQHRAVEMVIFRTERIKEVKKLRQRLAYTSLACKSSWILITSLDLFDNLKSGGKKFAKSIFRVKKFRIRNIIFFHGKLRKPPFCLGVFPILWRKKIPSSPTSFFSFTINNAHEAVNALRKIDLQIQQKVMNSVNLLRS